MIVTDRSKVVSSFTIVKGALISETFEALAQWDFQLSKKANLDRLRRENYIGAPSDTWLRDVAKVLNRRLDPSGRDRPLVTLARGGVPMEEWRPIYLWHLTRDEFLVRDFLAHWLFKAYEDGAYRLRAEDVHQYLQSVETRGGQVEHTWTDATLQRVAAGLMRLAVDFGLLRGTVVKEFAGYHLPERSLVYLLHAVLEHEGGSSRRMMNSAEWRIFLLRPADLEAEVLRLHQFRTLEYQTAGTIVELSLPNGSAAGYAEAMVG